MSESENLSNAEHVALIHHIELDKAGWWEKAVQKLALTAFHIRSDKPALSAEEIVSTLQEHFQIGIPVPEVSCQLEALLEQEQILALGRDLYKISEATLRQCQREIDEATQLEVEVENRFAEQLSRFCPHIDSVFAWKLFVEKFLVPVVNQLGASTYQLLTGERSPDNLTQIDDFLKCFHSEYELDLGRFLRGFLSPSDALVRRFVLRTMNAFFVVRAGGLNKTTVERLSSSKAFSATLFFDSNVLFSLLGLHENPADHGSRMLVDLVRKLSSTVPIRLRVLPPTLDEMRRVMKASQDALINLRISPKLLQPAINIGLTGITARYLELSAEHKGTVAPGDYFEPYLNNLITILRSRGVELFNQDLSSYGTRQDVIDDILERQTFEKQRYGPRAKSYEQLRHDMVIWHFVKDKRPVRPESPIDAEYWMVTADFRMLGFDVYKHKTITSDVPICMFPAALVQLLRFWLPLDEEFESALFSAIRLPAVITPGDSDAERISLQILNALSTFDNIADLPEETATRVLLNDALRQKVEVERDISKQIELVREALIEENKAAEGRLEAEKARSFLVQQQSRALEMKLDEKSREIMALKEEVQQKSLIAQQNAEQIGQLVSLRMQTSARVKFSIVSLVILVPIAGAEYAMRLLGTPRTLNGGIIGGLLICWIVAIRILGEKQVEVKEWSIFRSFGRATVWAILTLLGGIAGNAAWDGIKSLITK